MKAGQLWPLAIGGVLGVTVLANIWLLYSATDRNAAVVEPDYYRKALNYDSTMAQEQANITLGWKVDLQTFPVTDDGRCPIELRLRDAGGDPVTGAAVHVTGIHNLAAARRPAADLSEAAEGTYAGSMALMRAGFWEFRIEVVRGSDRFTRSLQRDVPFARRPDTDGTP